MRLQTLQYAALATLVVAAAACGRGNNDNTAVGDTRPDAAATSRAATVTNSTGTPEQPAAGTPTDRGETRAAGTAGRTAPAIAAPTEHGTITMKIQAKYASDDVIKGRNIDVDTINGVVTLKGQVDTRREKDAAEQLARETEGVKRVIDNLKVATH